MFLLETGWGESEQSMGVQVEPWIETQKDATQEERWWGTI
jgi:hypothetical protein